VLLPLLLAAASLCAQTGDSVTAEERLLDEALNGADTTTNKPTEMPVETPAAAPSEVPAEPPVVASPAPVESPAVVPVETPVAVAPEVPVEVPAAAPSEVPAEPPVVASPAPVESPAVVPVETPVAAAPEVPAEVPAAAPVEAPVAVAPAVPVEVPAATPAEVPAETPAEATPATTVEMPVATPVEAAVPNEAPPPAASSNEPRSKSDGPDSGVDESAPSTTVQDADNQEKIQKEILEIQAWRDVELGQKAMAYKAYETALGHFESAEQILPGTPRATQMSLKANEGAMICQYNIALAKLEADELEGDKGALVYAKNALGRNRKFKAAQLLVERIEFRIAEEREKAKKQSVRRTTAPDYIAKKQTMELWLEMAVQHIRVEEYTEAEAKLKMVLAIDPANPSAMKLLSEIQDAQYKVKTKERESMSKEAMKAVREDWNLRDYYYYVDPVGSMGPNVFTNTTKNVGEDLRAKMESITIQEINFVDANIHNVIQILGRLAQEGDTMETDPRKKGVNFILKLGESTPKTITFGAKYVSLMEAVKIITDVAGLSYRLDGRVVMILPADEADSAIVTRFYAVDPAVVRTISAGGGSVAPAGEEPAAGGFDQPAAAAGAAGEAASELMEPLKKMGIRFPRGSSITYSPGISKIIHANTVGNLAMFEKILAEFNIINPQVEIETRFVDISQTDLDELGFEWRLMDNIELLQKKGSGALPVTARPRVTLNANNASGGFTKGLRYDTAGPAGALLAIESTMTSADMLWLLHAVEQSGHADLLSAPKITTQPGEEATVKVTTEYIYPTEYTVQGGVLQNASTTAGSWFTTPIMMPQGFETREVGVILTVKPEVSPDRSVISLILSPDVVTDPTWHDYGYTLADGSQVPMMMPFFHRRTATTTVRVYDGATVVMGGMITEDLNTTDDQIPLLGSIPVIGRLFQSKSKQSMKRNLLIFVTARLVDPAGRAYKQKKAVIPDSAH